MSSPKNQGSPQKRVKLFHDGQALTTAESGIPADTSPAMLQREGATHAAKEAEVGITDYVTTEARGFRGLLKKRYTDFIVNEILPDGRVVHLHKLGKATKIDTSEDHSATVSSESNEKDLLTHCTSESANSTLEWPSPNEEISKQPKGREPDGEEAHVRAHLPGIYVEADARSRFLLRVSPNY